MSRQYDNTNRGALFVNDQRQSEKHPDWRGSINVAGVDYWISGWSKESQRGEMISLAVTLKEEQPRSGPPARERGPAGRQYPRQGQRAPATNRSAPADRAPPARTGPPRQQAQQAQQPTDGFEDDDIPF